MDRRAGRRHHRVRQAPAAGVPAAAGGGHRRGLPARPDLRGGGAALGRSAPARGDRPPRLRAPGHRRHGLQLVLPDRVGPDQARQGQRHPGRPGPGERGRLRRGLLPGHHRHGPHPLRPALRALPQPEPDLDARHRHGLRLPLPGRDDPLRVGEVRPGPRGADHHLLDHQGPGRGPRRRPRARPPLRPRRPGGQGHAAPRDGPGHAAAVLPRGAPPLPRRVQGRGRPALDVRGRPRRQAGGRRRPRPGGAAPAGRDPRRRGGHHQGAADHLPAHPAQARAGPGARRRPDRHPVRDARRRGPGPAQDGLPRAAQPRRHHRHRRPGPGDPGSRVRHRHRAPRRRRRLRAARPGRHAGRVPAGVPADAVPPALAGADRLRRRLGRPRPVPAGADGRQHAQRLRRPEERPAGRPLHPPRRRGGPGRHLRPDDLPGVGDADEPALRRLLPGRRRQPAQGLRQEDPGAHGQGAGQVRRRLRRHRLRAGARHAAVRHHRGLRRLRLRQEPRLRLRPHHLPDGLPQGALPGRVPGLPADQREGQPGEGGRLPGRLPGHGHQGPAARRQPVGGRLHRARPPPTRRPGCRCRRARSG